jgi:cytochrome c-type biogenesis protein CcsB
MGIREDRRIFMNNVLKHRGYRFYQSSYDPDEKGTVLSVNKDRWGTSITYIGYSLLMLGMLLALFDRGTRFSGLARRSVRSKGKIAAIILLLVAGTPALHSQSFVPPKDIAADFGNLWVQGNDGRYEPVNTLSGEVVRKVTGKSRYKNYTSDQVMLGMVLYPEVWQEQLLFDISNAELQRMVGFKGEYVSFNDLVDQERGYLLADLVNQAYSKEVPLRTDLDKEVIKLDDRINAMYLVQSGDLLRIFPGNNLENYKWYSVADAIAGRAREVDSLGAAFLHYLDHIQRGEYNAASSNLSAIVDFQKQFTEMIPDERQKNIEILYNKSLLFPRLGKFYGLFGLILIVLQFIRTFRRSKLANYLFTIGVIHLGVAFIFHTLGFLARWYVSGHAPLSNGYESMIFVSWVTLLAGLIFVRRSGFAIALTAILASLSLLVANMSWMNPEITNLVPVLKSVWLTIHVTVVMAGYGFLGLASLMGLTTLVFYALLNKKNRSRIEEVTEQITIVNHMTLIIGLYFMTAGVFLGGVWANESWGRYWGWDPKETWALITVLVYAFVAHMHRIPGMKGNYAFNLASFFGYGSVLMTYFGVNYFLGGIHSYAGGSPFSLPWYSYAIVIFLIILSIIAYNRQIKFLPGKAIE